MTVFLVKNPFYVKCFLKVFNFEAYNLTDFFTLWVKFCSLFNWRREKETDATRRKSFSFFFCFHSLSDTPWSGLMMFSQLSKKRLHTLLESTHKQFSSKIKHLHTLKKIFHALEKQDYFIWMRWERQGQQENPSNIHFNQRCSF